MLGRGVNSGNMVLLSLATPYSGGTMGAGQCATGFCKGAAKDSSFPLTGIYK